MKHNCCPLTNGISALFGFQLLNSIYCGCRPYVYVMLAILSMVVIRIPIQFELDYRFSL